jgi:hypothetical protein
MIWLNVRVGSNADNPRCPKHVGFTPESGHSSAASAGRLSQRYYMNPRARSQRKWFEGNL